MNRRGSSVVVSAQARQLTPWNFKHVLLKTAWLGKHSRGMRPQSFFLSPIPVMRDCCIGIPPCFLGIACFGNFQGSQGMGPPVVLPVSVPAMRDRGRRLQTCFLAQPVKGRSARQIRRGSHHFIPARLSDLPPNFSRHLTPGVSVTCPCLLFVPLNAIDVIPYFFLGHCGFKHVARVSVCARQNARCEGFFSEAGF